MEMVLDTSFGATGAVHANPDCAIGAIRSSPSGGNGGATIGIGLAVMLIQAMLSVFLLA